MTENPVRWFEIYVSDMERAKRFYETVLQAKLQRLESPAQMEIEMWSFPMSQDQPGAAGALVKMDGFSAGGNSVLVYFGSADCAIEAQRVVAAGGKVCREKFSIGQYGFIVLATDTEGNMFGIHSME